MRASHLCRGQLRLLPCAAALAGALSVFISYAPPTLARAHKTFTVVIDNMLFTPAALSVRRGDRVVWINKDLFAHTVTADSHRFESGEIPAAASWSYSVTVAGEYAYSCRFHPTMRGHLTVQP